MAQHLASFPDQLSRYDLPPSAGRYPHLHNSMKRRFEQNQQDCVFTVLSLLPTLGDQLLHELNVELITAKLQQSRSQRSTPALTPDGSMILPPKPAEGETTSTATAESATVTSETAVNDGDVKSEADKSEAVEQASDKDADQEPAAAENHTAQGSEDVSKVDSDSEQYYVVDNAGDTDGSPPEAEKETSEKQSTASESVPEIQIQQDVETDTPAQQQAEAVEVSATQLPTTVEKDETTAAIDRRVKLELWNELKIMSFTRTITALYSLTFLTLLTQVQLNLLGRFTYVSSVVALTNTTDAAYRIESPSAKGSLSSTNGLLDFQTEKKYLTFSYWLLHEGWRRWNEKVQEVVESVIGT